MRRARKVLSVVAAAALVCATASAQLASDSRNRMPRMSVEFEAERIEYDTDADAWEASGTCKVTMKLEGEYEGTMQSEALRIMRAHTDAQEITAPGPVTLKIIMTRHRDGAQVSLTSGLTRQQGGGQVEISAACTGEAVVDTREETIVLRGSATAEVRSLGEREAQPAGFAGDTIILDLKSKKITVTKAILGWPSEP